MKVFKILLLTLLISCQGTKKNEVQSTEVEKKHSQTAIKERDINMLNQYSHTYVPMKIDFSDNDTLNSFDLDYIFNSKKYEDKKELKDGISSIFLLKLYLHHIKDHNQGFDLLSMRKKEAKYLIDYFLKSNGKDSTEEFINTAYPYNVLKDKGVNNKEIEKIINDIKIETEE